MVRLERSTRRGRNRRRLGSRVRCSRSSIYKNDVKRNATMESPPYAYSTKRRYKLKRCNEWRFLLWVQSRKCSDDRLVFLRDYYTRDRIRSSRLYTPKNNKNDRLWNWYSILESKIEHLVDLLDTTQLVFTFLLSLLWHYKRKSLQLTEYPLRTGRLRG